MEIQVGQEVKADGRSGKKNFSFTGIVVEIIEPFRKLSSQEVWKYAELNISKKDTSIYKSVQGENCKVQRLVLKLNDSINSFHHTIIPNNGKWKFEVVK